MKTKFKTLLLILAMTMLAKTNANAQEKKIHRKSPRVCRLIDNDNKVIIAGSDTLAVYGTRIIFKNGNPYVVCNLGTSQSGLSCEIAYDYYCYNKTPLVPKDLECDEKTTEMIQTYKASAAAYYNALDNGYNEVAESLGRALDQLLRMIQNGVLQNNKGH